MPVFREFRRQYDRSFKEVPVVSMNPRQLHTFCSDMIKGGAIGQPYEDDLEMVLASNVLLKIHSFIGHGKGNVFPYSPDVVGPRVVELVVEHLQTKCGYPATYVLNNRIIVTANTVIERSSADVVLLQQQINVQDGTLVPSNQ